MQRIKFKLMASTVIRSTALWPPPLSIPSKLVSFSYSSSSSSATKYPQWSGLQNWRQSAVNENRFWGSKGPEPPVRPLNSEDKDKLGSASSLAEMGAIVLSTPDPITKSNLSHLAYSTWRLNHLPVGVSQPPGRPARPPKPDLVSFA